LEWIIDKALRDSRRVKEQDKSKEKES